MSLKTILDQQKQRIQVGVCVGLLLIAALVTGFVSVKHVKVNADGQIREVITTYARPDLVLRQAGITLAAQDEYRMSTESIKDQTQITVYRAVPVTVEYEGKTHHLVTGKPTVGELLDTIGYSRERVASFPGENAKIQENLHIRIKNLSDENEEQENQNNSDGQTAAESAAEPHDSGRQYISTSRGMMRFSEVKVMEASAYLPSDGGGSGITASGMRARHGIVAVDPDVIPLGTRLFIPGYGLAIAADTGGAILGDKIDLCMEDYGSAMDFGRRDVRVYVLD